MPLKCRREALKLFPKLIAFSSTFLLSYFFQRRLLPRGKNILNGKRSQALYAGTWFRFYANEWGSKGSNYKLCRAFKIYTDTLTEYFRG